VAHTLSAVQVLDDKAAEQEILVQARIVAEEKAKADLAAQQLRDREAARHADMHDHHELFVGESARQAKLIQPIPDHVKNNGGACSHRLHPSHRTHVVHLLASRAHFRGALGCLQAR
jgi:hypothetical protein